MSTHSAATRTVDSTRNKIKQRQARVGIIGLGYVGLPLALLFTDQKFAVTGFDIDQRKVDTLAKGDSYIYRIAAKKSRHAKAKGFSATSDYAHIERWTLSSSASPRRSIEYHEPDLSYITDTTHAIAPHLQPGSVGRAGEHNVSRHHGRSDGSDSRERKQAWT